MVGSWRVLRHVATGGFGTVYEVEHATGGGRGALKLLHPHLIASPEMVARLVREAQVIAQARHRHVVELLDAGTDADGQPFLVMEYLEGCDVNAYLAARGRLAPAEALAILEPLCDAVTAIHEMGVIHRDIKASNAFLEGPEGARRVVLLDFGIAKLLDAGGVDLTASRQALGTPASMAPEQIRGGEVDRRTDVYALGALAFHLLTGRMPFDDASMTMSQYMHLHASRPRPSASAPLGAAVDDVIARAMAIDPARRYTEALAFFAALRDALVGERDAAATVTSTGTGILVSARATSDDDDDALLDDLDGVFPRAETELVAHGFAFARDLGDAMLFVRDSDDLDAATAAARALGTSLAQRPGKDPRVAVRIAVHRAELVRRSGQPAGGALCDPAGWGLADEGEGLWVGGGTSGFARLA
jgi:serine/threonine protein kinase